MDVSCWVGLRLERVCLDRLLDDGETGGPHHDNMRSVSTVFCAKRRVRAGDVDSCYCRLRSGNPERERDGDMPHEADRYCPGKKERVAG